MASTFFGIRTMFVSAVVVVCCFFCLPTTVTSLPMKDIIGQSAQMAKLEQHQQQQHRQKRAVTKTQCSKPDNLNAMFQQINSQLGPSMFLNKAINDKAISIPAGEESKVIDGGDPNEVKTCPATITTNLNAPLAHRSLCPYYFDVLRLPEGYFPAALPWAKCKCTRCIQNNVYGCEAVRTNITVLKPVGCFQGMQKYEEESIQVPTSCACAFTGNNEATTVAPTSTTTASWGV